MVIDRNGEHNALVVGRVVQQKYTCRLGYKRISLGQVRELSIIYGGIVGCDSEDISQIVLGHLTQILKKRTVDLVRLSHLNTGSHLFKLASSKPGVLSRDHLIKTQPHWKAMLPETQAFFLQRLKKKHRYWIRRLEKLVEQDFPGQITYRGLEDNSQLPGLMNDLERVASKTYQRRLGAGFRNDAEHVKRFTMEADKNWLRIYVLYLGIQPCAFWIGTYYKGVFYSDYTGYDPEFRKYEPGTLVFMNMVEQLCAERADAIDFGLGDALYKQRFGDESWSEASVRIFAPSLHAMLLNITQTCIEAPVLWLKSFFERTRLQQRIKTLWRRRLLKQEDQ